MEETSTVVLMEELNTVGIIRGGLITNKKQRDSFKAARRRNSLLSFLNAPQNQIEQHDCNASACLGEEEMWP